MFVRRAVDSREYNSPAKAREYIKLISQYNSSYSFSVAVVTSFLHYEATPASDRNCSVDVSSDAVPRHFLLCGFFGFVFGYHNYVSPVLGNVQWLNW